MTTPNTRRVLASLATASFAQHMPLLFLLTLVPAKLREGGASLSVVSAFALVFVPFALQFLWAPAVERAQAARLETGRPFGFWKSWLISAQIAITVALAIIASAPLEPDSVAIILPAMIALAVLAGTQKIALGGFAIAHLSSAAQRATGTAAMGLGAALGSLAGTIGLIALFAAQGWTTSLLVCAAVILSASAIYVLAPIEPKVAAQSDSLTGRSLRTLSRRPGFWKRLLSIVVVGAPIGLAYGLVQPRLVDAGVGVETIGLVNGLSQIAAWLAVAPLAAYAVRRLGGPVAIRAAIVVNAVAFGGLGAATILFADGVALAVASACAALASLIGVSTAAYPAFMHAAERDGQPAAGFSLYLSLFGLSIIAAAGASGLIGDAVGYGAVLLIAAVASAAGFAAARFGSTD